MIRMVTTDQNKTAIDALAKQHIDKHTKNHNSEKVFTFTKKWYTIEK